MAKGTEMKWNGCVMLLWYVTCDARRVALIRESEFGGGTVGMGTGLLLYCIASVFFWRVIGGYLVMQWLWLDYTIMKLPPTSTYATHYTLRSTTTVRSTQLESE